MVKTWIVLAALATTGAAGIAQASPNLISNGNFASGDLTGFTLGGTQQTYAPQVIQTGPGTGGAFGETIPLDNAVSASPDPVVGFAAYFVDDFAVNQSLTQSIMLGVGHYTIGFDYYIPFNGFANANDASFSGSIAGITLASFNVSSGTAGIWTNVSATVDIAVAGFYDASFLFNSNGFPSKDVVIDRVFVTQTDVPEPASLALLCTALGGLAFARRRGARA